MKINKFTSLLIMVTFGFFTHSFAALPILEESYFVDIKTDEPQEEVFMLQTVLNELGYIIKEDENGEASEPSGIYDKDTIAAVKEFQKENELEVTGKINSETIKVINELVTFVNENENQDSDSDTENSEMQGEVVRLSIWESIYNFFFGWLK